MKIAAAFACLLMVVLVKADLHINEEALKKVLAQMKDIMKDCSAEVGLTEADAIELITDKDDPDTRPEKCLLACMAKRMGIFTKDGKVDVNKAREEMLKFKDVSEELYDKYEPLMEKCINTLSEDADECEAAAKYLMCMEKEKKAAGLGLPIVEH